MTTTQITYQHTVLILGSGAAGLSLALKLAEHSKVAVMSKSSVSEGSTRYAQGGIAAVFDEKDSIDAHVEDTLRAGAGLCDRAVAEFTARNARASMEWLVDTGVNFDRVEQASQSVTKKTASCQFHLTQEGGHSHRRILHAADATGLAVQETLTNRVINHPNIELFEHFTAIDLIKSRKRKKHCLGVYALNQATGTVDVFAARFLILATGGSSKVYQYTSNPDIASGDGVAMAWRAGCQVANMEFNQFHPTCLYHPDAQNFLISEALRGEGAHLIDANGERFMHRFDDRAELAPRDIVARAIDFEMKRLGQDCMFLDISHKDDAFIIKHFPTIHEKCLSLGIDICKQPIPVVPAAHYSCGGVVTDLNARTTLKNLYAIGEVAYTGLHGANRMASNSLLECVVFAHAAAQHITERLDKERWNEDIKPWDSSRVSDSDEEVIIQHNWHELRLFMWDYVGIVRTDKRLQRALRRIELLRQEINEYYAHFTVTTHLIELRNLVTVAELIVKCALKRKESRGLHYNLDHPEILDNSAPTILKKSSIEPHSLSIGL